MSATEHQDTQTTGATSSNTQPGFAPQVGALTTAFDAANTALGKAQGATAPTDFTAQFTPQQIAAFQSMLGYGTSGTQGAQTAQAGGALATAGVPAVQGALSGLTNFKANGGNTADNIANATAYANDPSIAGQVTAAMRDANRNATENVLPGIERGAALGGNTDSSRTGIAQGIVSRGLNDSAADISANLRGALYTKGLDLSQNAAQVESSQALDALKSTGTLGVGATTAGTGALGDSVNQQGGLYNIAQGGIAGEQAAAQADLTNQQQQFEAKTNDPFAALQNYYNIVGANNWGSSSTGTSTGTSQTQKTPSQAAQIGGWLKLGGQVAGSFA